MAIFAPTIGIDLGTTNTLIYVHGRGVVINEPSIVAVDKKDRRKIHAVGDDAEYMLGRTDSSVSVIRPIRNGTIADFDMTEIMLRYFIRKAIGVSHVFTHPLAIVSVPCRMKEVDRKAVSEAVHLAGAKRVTLIEKPYAAAVGTGLPVFEPVGNMVVDIGGGTTDIAVVSLSGIVVCKSIDVGGNSMNEAIYDYLKRDSVLVSEQTAEEIKHDLGSAMPLTENRRVRVRGRDAVSAGFAKDVDFTSMQCCEALRGPCEAICDAVSWVFERTPAELCSDLKREGIHLTGGGANLFAIDRMLANRFGLPVRIAKDPADCTVMGLGYLVENPQLVEVVGRQYISDEN